MSEDPIGFRGNDVNLIRYVANIPNNKNDKLGLKTQADMRNEVTAAFNRYVNTLYRNASTSTNFKYPDEFGIKTHVSRQQSALLRVGSFNETPPPGMFASFKVYRITGSILKYDASMSGSAALGSSIAHELTHAYQYYNNIVVFADMGKEYDEQLAYCAESIYSTARTRIGGWELALFAGVSLSGDPVQTSDLSGIWNNLWDITKLISIPRELISKVTIEWNSGSRLATYADYSAVKVRYDLKISCEKVRNYSIPTLTAKGLNPKCFQCPSNLPVAFK